MSSPASNPTPAESVQQQQGNAANEQQQAQGNFTPAAAGATASASLYVGELDPTVTEAMLFEMFNMIGPVASIRVCRDAVTRRSLGYAYVNFHNVVDGERALESLNYTLIKGKPCRIMWSQRDPALRKTGSGNIFIKNLDATIDNKALHDTFSAFGNILSCKVAMEDGSSKGYGFVHYETHEAAENAIKHVNGMLLNDKKVFVGHHIPKKERQSKIDEIKANFTNIYVKNLDTEVTDEEFHDMFAQYGAITSAVIQRDEDGKSKGFGFVNFEDHEAAKTAVEELHEKEVNGKALFVSRAQKKAEREDELKKQYEQAKLEKMSKYQGVNLYVKNIDDDIDDEKLRQEFSVYGAITSAKVMRDDKTGASKGFGFVCFSAPDEATKAVTEMNGRMIGSKPIYVALAQRKDVRRSQLEAQMAQRNQIRMQQAMPMPGAPGYMPGAPMFYAPPGGFMPQGQRPVFPQNGMVARPRWGRPQRGPRPPRGGGAPQAGGRPQPAGQNGPGRKFGNQQRPNAPNGAQAETPAGPQALTAAALAAAPPEMQKQMLGERLYPLIHQQQPEYAGKITGMLLEMQTSELLHLLEDNEALESKITEAVEVLEEHLDEAPEASEETKA
ncbi:hypothetical protein K450DRAFT_226424 [Umbelopsis ramanniana AG]|uniref:Polyadenylate-binding protein n=1 Tax=Umbelopsis ramanniana AG TaxID=1314678 RepID=A0AAD5EF12_UMBRA|nr:uncharacterized protein K450DRAFT_226424 [Umbelopsis ramanniana AG]KAI8582688.1 hypothetical protein K450DRAFT_226424 [Umbelopsis ramanniana AG]